MKSCVDTAAAESLDAEGGPFLLHLLHARAKDGFHDALADLKRKHAAEVASIRQAQDLRTFKGVASRMLRKSLTTGWNKWMEVYQKLRREALEAQHQSQLTGQTQSFGQRVARMQQGQQQMIIKTIARMQTEHATKVSRLRTSASHNFHLVP